jgi:CHAD domain-containing protein
MEIEAKFAVPDDPTFDRLLSLEMLGEYLLVPVGEARTTDHYLDTANRDLLQSGHAVRRRIGEEGGPERVTLKGLGGVHGAVHQRTELEVEVPPDTPPERWPPGPPRDLVLQLAHEEPLVEVLTLAQHRTTRDVLRKDRRIAVLSLDRIEFADGTTARELEIELAPDGSGADLRTLEKLLVPFGLKPEPLSKFERALALLGGAAPAAADASRARGRTSAAAAIAKLTRVPPRASRAKPMGVGADDPMVEAGRKILRFHWDQAIAHEAGTVAGADPEELHDMRVATRRQRAALRFMEPYCRKKTVRPVRDGLRNLGGSLGAVRDLDVLLAAARGHQETLGADEARAFEELLKAWTRQREAARQRMVEYLRGQAHAGFKEQYTSFLDTAGAGARSDASPRPTLVRHVLPYELWAHYGALCAFERVLPWASAETLHALRIEGKRLRYLLEFFREVLDGSVEKPVKSLIALQDHLGELQDGVVTIGRVGEFIAGPVAVADPAAAAAAGRYREARKARIEELRRGIERPWSGVTAPEFRASLSRAVTEVQKKPSRRPPAALTRA